MCLNPVLIDNPYFNTPVSDPKILAVKNTTDSKLQVPCGHCAVCVALRQCYLVQRVQMEALDHDLFYGTLTYKNSVLPRAKYGDLQFAYPDFSDWQKMIKMIRKNYPLLSFRYMLVSEYGEKKHRPHFHFILSLPRVGKPTLAERISTAKFLFDIFLKFWRRNIAPPVWSEKRQKWRPNTRSPVWESLLTYVRRNGKYNYDLHYLDPNSSKDGLDGVSYYVTKYILKYDKWTDKFKSKLFFNLSKEDYKEAYDKFRPRCLLSKGFGSPESPSVAAHIRSGISLALNDPSAFYPYYISKHNGKTFPLAPYYQKKFLTPFLQTTFFSRRPDFTDDDLDLYNKRVAKFNSVKSFLASQVHDFDYDEMDDINLDNISKFYEHAETFRSTQFSQDFADSWQDFEFDSDSHH